MQEVGSSSSVMRSHNEQFTVWWEGELMDGSVLYLTEDKRLPHVARFFDNDGVARALHEELMSNHHPTLASFLPVFEISGKYVLAFGKRGQSLAEILEHPDRNVFHDGLWITKFYKNMLMDALTIIRNYLLSRVKVTLEPSSVFVMDGRVTVTKLSLRNNNALKTLDDYKEICKITGAINAAVGNIGDVEALTKIINEQPREIENVDSLPLFWSTWQRLDFPAKLWDALGDGSFSLKDPTTNTWPFGGKRLFDQGPSSISGHAIFGPWYTAMHAKKMAKTWVEERCSHGVLPFLKVDGEVQARLMLCFIRKCFGHFRQEKAKLPRLPCVTDQELAIHFERFFPGSIWSLYRVGLAYERNYNYESMFVPRQPCLSNLWCSEEDLNPYRQ